MKNITLGKTGIVVPQNGFGALPLQRIPKEDAVCLLRRAFEGGMRFFDTARAYTDSEEKLGAAFEGIRSQLYIATKTKCDSPDQFWKHLETSLGNLKTDYIDLYQFHFVDQCYVPGDGTGLYEAMEEAKRQGLIRHIGITTHRIDIAEEIIKCGLYETLQYPFSYLSSDREQLLPEKCAQAGMGMIAMKGLSGGLLTHPKACMAFMQQFDNLLPIWGIQRESELDDWLAFFHEDAVMDEEAERVIRKDREELAGDFCRGCGYCAPCSVGIVINQCARMSLMIRRAPAAGWLNEHWQKEMEKINDCIECGICMTRCPYGLQIPQLLRKNLEDYRHFIS